MERETLKLARAAALEAYNEFRIVNASQTATIAERNTARQKASDTNAVWMQAIKNKANARKGI